MSKAFTEETLVEVFPSVLGEDPDLLALANAVAKELHALYQDNNLLAIYARINELPERLLDILAYDFKVDWYLYDAPISVKRRQIRSLFEVHKHLGTKEAMERALSDIFDAATVEEWYKYGGPPYAFRLEVTIPEEGVTEEQQRRALENIKYYKNVRSWLEGVNYTRECSGQLKVGAYASVAGVVEVWPVLVDHLEMTAKVATSGAVVQRQQVEIYPG